MTPAKPDDRSTLVDPQVGAAWHAASGEEPPASVDTAILAAARREVSAKPQSIDTRDALAARRRWWPLAAAATLAAVTVGILQVTPIDKLGAPATESAIVSDVPAPVAPPALAPKPPEAPPAALKMEQPGRSDDAPAKSDAQQRIAPPGAPRVAANVPPPVASPAVPSTARPAATSVVPPAPPAHLSAAPTEPGQSTSAAPAPDPFPAAKQAANAAGAGGQVSASPPPAPPRAEAAANVARERDAPARQPSTPAAVGASAASSAAERAPPASAPAAPAPLAKMAAGRAADSSIDEARAKDRTPLPIPDWIALIRRLRAEGKQAEAAKELAAFRVAHTDHEKLLPPDLRDWRPPEK